MMNINKVNEKYSIYGLYNHCNFLVHNLKHMHKKYELKDEIITNMYEKKYADKIFSRMPHSNFLYDVNMPVYDYKTEKIYCTCCGVLFHNMSVVNHIGTKTHKKNKDKKSYKRMIVEAWNEAFSEINVNNL